jgi:putative hydrolase of the HAD superfamily
MSLSHNPRPEWSAVDTVLLDMDGTLLDQRFDNYFWQELVPERFAARHALAPEAAHTLLRSRFAATHGTLNWYCTDYWSRELQLDIAALKREVREHVRFLPGAREFLEELRRRGLRTVLITNAHQDSLSIKAEQTDLLRHFDVALSSHQFGAPKEHPQFWQRLRAQLAFEPSRSLFVDDSLPVLRAASAYGIAQVFAISRPDSTRAAHAVHEFPAVAAIIDLLDG